MRYLVKGCYKVLNLLEKKLVCHWLWKAREAERGIFDAMSLLEESRERFLRTGNCSFYFLNLKPYSNIDVT